MKSATFISANLKSAKLNNSFMDGANLEGADLRGADLKGVADVSKEQLIKTMLCSTNLPDNIDLEQLHCTTVEVLVGLDGAEIGQIINP